MRKTLATFSVWLLAVSAQQGVPQGGSNTIGVPRGTVTFSTTRQLVVEDVIVKSQNGKPVDNLKASDFRSEEHTSELQSLRHLVCRLLLEKKKKARSTPRPLLQPVAATPKPDQGRALPVSSRILPVRCAPVRSPHTVLGFFFFFFNDPAPTEIYPLSLHDVLPISITFPNGASSSSPSGEFWYFSYIVSGASS